MRSFKKYRKGQMCPECKDISRALNMTLSILTGMCSRCRGHIKIPKYIPNEQYWKYILEHEKEKN